MLLYYVRHGHPIYNPNQLTELGLLQADAVGKRLAVHGMDKIYASTSNRARQTAQPLCNLLRMEAEVLDWTNEDYAWNEMTVTYEDGRRTWAFWDPETRRLFNSREVRQLGREWYTHPAFANTTFGQGITRIQREADAFMENLGYRHDLENNCYYTEKDWDGRVALFAHEGFGAAFLSCILDIPYPIFSTHSLMTHSGVTAIQSREKDGIVIPELLTYSNDSHIYREGLPTKFRNEFFL